MLEIDNIHKYDISVQFKQQADICIMHTCTHICIHNTYIHDTYIHDTYIHKHI